MHELGVVFHIMKTVKNVAVQNDVTQIATVTVELGEVSTVIPSYLTDCWQWARAKEEMFKDCALEIETIPALTYCENCGKTYGTVEHGKICPFCQSEKTYLVQGNEFNVKEIEAC